MNRCIRGSARIGLTVCAALSLVGPLYSRGAASETIGHSYRAGEADPLEDGLMLTETPMAPLINHSGRSGDSNWIRLQTDPCGLLQQVSDGRSMFTQSALGDDMIVDQDDEEDPSDAGRELIGRWLSQHSKTAVVNEGIDKSCDRDWYGDQDLSAQFDAAFKSNHLRKEKQPDHALQIA